MKIYNSGVFFISGCPLGDAVIENDADAQKRLESNGYGVSRNEALKNTIAYGILEKHNTSGDMEALKIKFDCITSHDITYVNIIQTARASGLDKFPIPYILTNCHNSLCAVGGTINEDDHVFGLSAAKKYGGIYVPAHLAVIHQFMREKYSKCGSMILGSDSHTRYGALGTLAIGEGGGELTKQILNRTYDVKRPEVVGVYLTGKPNDGVGPQDIALEIIGAVFETGYVKNKIIEFVGDGIKNLSVEYRNGIDVMTTETTCLSSVWETDGLVKDYYTVHGRPEDYSELKTGGEKGIAYYDGFIVIDMSETKPMIAMPFHPSNVYTIEDLNANLEDIIDDVEKKASSQLDNSKIKFTLRDKIRNGGLYVEQGIIAGCAGGIFDNIAAAADILRDKSVGCGEFTLSVYPASQPVYHAMIGEMLSDLMNAGAVIKTAFCGPCFGAGDVPSNNSLSIRHTTRNFPSREGSKPSNGQIASVALMDARSIAATAINGGRITPATDIDVNYSQPKYFFNGKIYENKVYNGFGKPDKETELKFGPGIVDWPEMQPLAENILLKAISVITDPVTTTDELIPSGETSSFRSNPLGLAEFTLSRKDPSYVGLAKQVQEYERARLSKDADELKAAKLTDEVAGAYEVMRSRFEIDESEIAVGSVIYANKPGDGSAREQAASCQRVLGGLANIAKEYATKRYRSNLINWGVIPFITDAEIKFKKGEYIYIPGIRKAILEKRESIKAYAVSDRLEEFELSIGDMTDDERDILVSGCLINYYRQ